MTTHNKTLQIYNSRKYILEHLNFKRNYDTSEYEGFSINEVDAMMVTEQLDMLLTVKNTENDITTATESQEKTYVNYFLKGNLTDSSLRPIIEDLYHNSNTLTKSDCLVIIYDGEPTESLQSHLDHLYKHDGIFVVVLNIKRLQFNIFNHVLIPQVSVLTEVGKIELFKKFNISTEKQLPQISRYDPVALAICLRPSQVCKLIRKSPTSISSEYFRICV